MVIDHSDNIKCIRNKMINERAIFMAVKEKEVERAKKLRKDLSDNYKQQEKEAREQFRFKQEEKKKQIEQKIKEDESNYIQEGQQEMLKKRRGM